MASKPMADGTEVIADVRIKMKKDKGTQSVKGCIINYKELKLKCNESCSGCKCSIKYPIMLILPVRISPEDTKEIEANLYNFRCDKKQKLKLYSPKEVKEPQQLNHQFLPCSLEAIESFENGTMNKLIRTNKKKDSLEESQDYIREYCKSIAKVQPSELCKQGEQLFGIGKDNLDFRAKLVELNFCANGGGDLIKCNEDDSLDPHGMLLYREEKKYKNYDVKVIGSYSEDNHGKITFQLIYEQANNVPLNADFTSQSSAESDVQSTKPDTELENGLCEETVAVLLPENGTEAAVEKGHLGEDKVPEDCNGGSTASNLPVRGKETRPPKPSEGEEDTGDPYNSKEAAREENQRFIGQKSKNDKENLYSGQPPTNEIYKNAQFTCDGNDSGQAKYQRVGPTQGLTSGIPADDKVIQLQEKRKNLKESEKYAGGPVSPMQEIKGESHANNVRRDEKVNEAHGQLQDICTVLGTRREALNELHSEPFPEERDKKRCENIFHSIFYEAVEKIYKSPYEEKKEERANSTDN